MKITNGENAVETTGIKSSAFQFEMNAKMYDMLISKLYKNKAGAVIRELSSNAWDAHVEAGNIDKPFEIALPTWLDKTFSIRDYGTGIPHDKFESIYTNIGSSTKEDTNELIGGFGLGSKTPFTLTDTFTVENICDGVKSTWLCFKSSGEPQVSKLAEESTKEPSGLKVAFAFTTDSVLDFTNELTKQLRYFPVKPIVTGGDGRIHWPEFPDGWETADYFYSGGTGYYDRNHNVVMGNVCYSFSSSDVDQKYNNLFNRSLTLKVNIGDLDIPPSRENLELTDKTKGALNSILSTIMSQYKKDFDVKLGKCTSYLDFRKVCSQANRSLLDSAAVKPKWAGKDYSWYDVSNDSYTPDNGTRSMCIRRSYQNVYRAQQVSLQKLADDKYTFYVNDLGRGFRKHINDNYQLLTDDNPVILEPSAYVKATHDAVIKETIRLGKGAYEKPIKLLSSVLGFPVIVKPAVGKAKPNQFFTLKEGHGGSLKGCSEPYTGDIPTKGYYIPISNWSTVETTKDHANLPEIASVLGEVDLLKHPIYLVRQASVSLVEAKLKPMKKLMKDLIPALTKVRDEHHIMSERISNLPSTLQGVKDLDWSKVAPEVHLLVKYRKELHNKRISFNRVRKADVIIGSTCKTKATHRARIDTLLKTYKEVYDPLFEAVQHGWQRDKAVKAIHTFLTVTQATQSNNARTI